MLLPKTLERIVSLSETMLLKIHHDSTKVLEPFRNTLNILLPYPGLGFLSLITTYYVAEGTSTSESHFLKNPVQQQNEIY